MSNYSIWIMAFGYFACYWPYSALTKILSKGLMTNIPAVDSFEALPLSAIGSVIGMILFLTYKSWWKFARHIQVGKWSIPFPEKWTFMSGVCSSFIIATTTLAYTFEGVSIVFVMLLMRGGVLIIAPVVDAICKRHVRWFSWIGLFLSFASLLVAFSNKGGYHITMLCAIDITIYLLAYFIRLQFMSRKAKSEDENANIKYFAEEQITSSPFLLFMLIVCGILGSMPSFQAAPGAKETMFQLIHNGFTGMFAIGAGWYIILLGVLSAGTGIFGGLVLLDKSENTYCVPVNRSSSIIAGLCATYTLHLFYNQPKPPATELIGAGLILFAIVFLTLPLFLKKKPAAETAKTEKS